MVTTGSALEGEAAQAIPPMHAKRTPVRCLALSADHDLGCQKRRDEMGLVSARVHQRELASPLEGWLPDNASNAQHREEHPHDGNQRQNSHVAGFADGLTKEHDTFRLCIIFRLISEYFLLVKKPRRQWLGTSPKRRASRTNS